MYDYVYTVLCILRVYYALTLTIKIYYFLSLVTIFYSGLKDVLHR
jgi:hypothetical protein